MRALRNYLGRYHWRVLALMIALYCLVALSGCALWRTESQSDEHRDRTTVTKEKRYHVGADGEWNETLYREEVSQEVAHAEQTREHSSPAVNGLGSILGGMSTGNPILDVIIGMLTAAAGGKGLAKVANHVTKKKEKPNA